jgi:hypothetical protein
VHGFTACPQQYFEWAELLSKTGIVVYLFTLPGHGKIKLADGQDNFKNLPSHNNFEKYTSLTEVINKVALSDHLPSSIGGLSVGGAIALHAAATSATPYDKIIMFSPFFKMPNFFRRHIFGPIMGNIPVLEDKKIGWGDGCYDEQKRGRAGVCEFTISQVYTAQVYGEYVMSLAKNISPTTLVQIAGVEKDKGSDTNATKEVSKLLGYNTNDKISICFYPNGANHSLLSRFDTPDEDKYWLPSLLNGATSFIVNGQKMPALKSSILEKNFKICCTLFNCL